MSDEAENFGETLLSYLPRLIRLAEKNMSRRLQTREGAEDVAHSVVKSVFKAYNAGKLKVNVQDNGQFWKYLAVVALNKIRKKARDNGAGKRDLSLDQSLSDIEYLIKDTRDPSDEEGELLVDVLQKLESQLDLDDRLIFQGKMAGLLNRQIAVKLNNDVGVSTKTVTRRWTAIQAKLRSIIEQLDLG